MQEIEKILKGFAVDIIIRMEPSGADWVVVETSPPIWVAKVDLSEKTVRISTNANNIRKIIGEMGVTTGKSSIKVLSHSQF